MNTTPPDMERCELDPTYLHARREALEILGAWAVALSWSVGYCRLFGYQADQPLTMVWGMPAWVFWGVAFPWGFAAAFTCYYSLVRIQDDDLGDANQGGEA